MEEISGNVEKVRDYVFAKKVIAMFFEKMAGQILKVVFTLGTRSF